MISWLHEHCNDDTNSAARVGSGFVWAAFITYRQSSCPLVRDGRLGESLSKCSHGGQACNLTVVVWSVGRLVGRGKRSIKTGVTVSGRAVGNRQSTNATRGAGRGKERCEVVPQEPLLRLRVTSPSSGKVESLISHVTILFLHKYRDFLQTKDNHRLF